MLKTDQVLEACEICQKLQNMFQVLTDFRMCDNYKYARRFTYNLY